MFGRWSLSILVFSLGLSAFGNDCPRIYRILGSGEPAHQAITHDLFSGRATHGGPVRINGNGHDLWKIQVRNDGNGRTREGFFKPRNYGDDDGYGRIPMEYVAYALNRKLGMDYVPPTVYRRWFRIGDANFGEGALAHAVPDAQILYDTDPARWGISKAAVQSDHRVLSVLLQNPDGHYKNLLLGKHWVDGLQSPVFIDFGASLRHGTSVTMTRYDLFRNSENVERVRHQTFDALKRLHWSDLQEWREFISEDEMRGILARRDGIVRYFEKLMAKRGYAAVFIEE